MRAAATCENIIQYIRQPTTRFRMVVFRAVILTFKYKVVQKKHWSLVRLLADHGMRVQYT